MFEVSGLSKKDIQEEYEDLVFRKVMAIYVENESRQILAEIKAEKESNNEPVDTKVVEKLYDKKERRENLSILWEYSKKVVSFAAMIVFVAIVSLSSAVVTFADVREAVIEAIYHLVYENNEEYMLVGMGDRTSFIDPEVFDWDGAYAPTYMPDDFSFENKKDLINQKIVSYRSDSEYVVIKQAVGAGYAYVDNENADYQKQIIINESEAVCVEKNGIVTIVWTCGDTFLSISGKLDYNDAIAIAEGLKIIK